VNCVLGFNTENMLLTVWGWPVWRAYELGPNAFQVQTALPHVAVIKVGDSEGVGLCTWPKIAKR
jgi:hypothetical protein